MTRILGRPEINYTVLFRTTCNLKLMNYFWNFPCIISRRKLTKGDGNDGGGGNSSGGRGISIVYIHKFDNDTLFSWCSVIT